MIKILASVERFFHDHPVVERTYSAGLWSLFLIWYFHGHLGVSWLMIVPLCLQALFRPTERLFWFLWGLVVGIVLCGRLG